MIAKSIMLNGLTDLLVEIEESRTEGNFSLFRGQGGRHTLLPSIARANPRDDTTRREKAMLAELRRTGDNFLEGRRLDDWELLVMAQHFGMKTRLLDWSTNPLAALWFACSGDPETNAFVYWFEVREEEIRGRSGEEAFNQRFARIFRPRLNNPRILAQDGWFTVHGYSEEFGRFVSLDDEDDPISMLVEYEFPKETKNDVLRALDMLGVNSASLFPDLEGLCKHINWKSLLV